MSTMSIMQGLSVGVGSWSAGYIATMFIGHGKQAFRLISDSIRESFNLMWDYSRYLTIVVIIVTGMFIKQGLFILRRCVSRLRKRKV